MATNLDDLDRVLQRYHLALGEIVKGDPEPLKQLYSHREEVSLANPFFPPVSGWDKAARNIERAARATGMTRSSASSRWPST